jgi:hypothetical protein
MLLKGLPDNMAQGFQSDFITVHKIQDAFFCIHRRGAFMQQRPTPIEDGLSDREWSIQRLQIRGTQCRHHEDKLEIRQLGIAEI